MLGLWPRPSNVKADALANRSLRSIMERSPGLLLEPVPEFVKFDGLAS